MESGYRATADKTTALCSLQTLRLCFSFTSRFTGVYEASSSERPALLKHWCQGAARSRFPAFQKLAKTFRQYGSGSVNYFQCRITQGAVEAINGIIQLAKRRARGFRNFSYLRTIAYLVAAKLRINLPTLSPT